MNSYNREDLLGGPCSPFYPEERVKPGDNDELLETALSGGFRVTDVGSGILADERDRVFDSGYSSKGERHRFGR